MFDALNFSHYVRGAMKPTTEHPYICPDYVFSESFLHVSHLGGPVAIGSKAMLGEMRCDEDVHRVSSPTYSFSLALTAS